jgi:hypothetical protein
MSSLVVYRGQSATFNVQAARAAYEGGPLTPVDLTTAQLTLKLMTSAPDGAVVNTKTIGNGINVVDAPNGLASFTITGADTASLDTLGLSFVFYTLTLEVGNGPEIIEDGTLQISSDPTSNLYITIQDIRDLGITVSQASDKLVLNTIKTWQQFIERACRQWFYPLELIMELDGTDSDAIHFGVPVISISELRLNGDSAPLNPRYYRIYNNLSSPGDRQNPRVKLIGAENGNRDIYTAPMKDGRLQFRHGRKNQYIKGVFGYVEADGTTPLLIVRALTKLVVEKLTKPVYVDPMNPPVTAPPLMSGVIVEEWTDGHKIKYAQSGGEVKPRAPGLAGITDDPEVLGILRLYKAPIGVATPNNPSIR